MRYQLLQISNGVEKILLDTDSKREIRERFYYDGLFRIRVDGKTLLMYQAEAWLNNRPIREYKEAVVEKKRKVAKDNGKCKPVILITPGGIEVQRFKSLSAAEEMGHGSKKSISRSCNTGKPTANGLLFRWAV